MDTDGRFSIHAWDELARQWELEEITFEQLNGQMLVWLGHLVERVATYQRAQDGMSRALTDLETRVQALEAR